MTMKFKPLLDKEEVNQTKKSAMININLDDYDLIKEYGGGYFQRGILAILEVVKEDIKKSLKK